MELLKQLTGIYRQGSNSFYCKERLEKSYTISELKLVSSIKN